MKTIYCAVCSTVVGKIEAGSKLKIKTVHICVSCAEINGVKYMKKDHTSSSHEKSYKNMFGNDNAFADIFKDIFNKK